MQIFNSTTLLLEQHSDWNNLYLTSASNSNWSRAEASRKYVQAEVYGDDGELLLLTNDGLIILARVFSESSIEEFKQSGYDV